ncbi:Major facilitator superfamily domain, general substrate transporter [Teratosphaeria destructans]|uniref:Major facilitator superfamily domain, general substrate transporter n=1 Tax=Teratosphaeria destructans TaxID=418781 RepID=A0A9W7SIH7_9PEZI|nr:Major facilitator superfamily domain, general substrate transporter [Teratosphaeria destructans]
MGGTWNVMDYVQFDMTGPDLSFPVQLYVAMKQHELWLKHMDSEGKRLERRRPSYTSEPQSRPIPPQPSDPQRLEISQWRGVVIMVSIFIGLFLSFLDTSVVAVALASIANEFGEFGNSNWVFTSYMLSYMAFGIILSRLSDIFGMAAVEIFSMLTFTAASLGCALSQSMLQLIVYRAIQGIGGSGLFSLTMVIGLRTIAPEKAQMMATYVGVTQTIAVVLGPILGGWVTSGASDSWRWIFYLNLPACIPAIVAFCLVWPWRSDVRRPSWTALRKVDVVGTLLLLLASVLLVFALQEAGAEKYAWNSPIIVAAFVVSGSAATAFVIWEIGLEKMSSSWQVEVVFPIRLLGDRALAAAFIVTTLNGFVWFVGIVGLPERFQIVSGDGPVKAGLRLLPTMGSAAVGTFIAAAMSSWINLTSYATVIASGLQVVGCGLFTSLTDTRHVSESAYGFQVLLGLGFGMSIASTTIMVLLRFLSRAQHLAVMQGCLTQMRTLGGSLGLAVATIIFHQKIDASLVLPSILSPTQLKALHESPLVISTFNQTQQAQIGQVYADAFTSQMRAIMYVAAAAFVCSLATIELHPPLPAAKQNHTASVSSD